MKSFVILNLLYVRPSEKKFWFSDNGFQKKGKVGRVFIPFFIFNPTWEGFLYFVFIFSGLKTYCKPVQFYYFGKQTTQQCLLCQQAGYSTELFVWNVMYIKTDEDSVFTRSHAEYLLSFSIDQSFKCLSKLVRVTGTHLKT